MYKSCKEEEKQCLYNIGIIIMNPYLPNIYSLIIAIIVGGNFIIMIR